MSARPPRHRPPGRALAAAVSSLLALVGAGLVTLTASNPTARGATSASGAAAPGASRHGDDAVNDHSTRRPRSGWIDVPVATMWLGRHKPRRVDRAAVSAHPDVHRWLSHLTRKQWLGLGDRVMTQALLGDRVQILVRWPRWSRIELVGQTGSVFRHGIIGWVPTAQVTTTPPVPRSGRLATVVARHASLHVVGTRRHMTASYGTTLPLVRKGPRRVVLGVPGIGRVAVASAAVQLRPHPTGAAVVRAAGRFLGTPYLWGGLSRWGIDCSGLTYLVYRQMGITLPRDAADQARHGAFVPRGRLRRGDLVFFGRGSWRHIHHVGIYAGHGLLLHAPHTGDHVRLTRLTRFHDYWGARRYLRR